jgi:hypothetical protein
LIVTQAVRPRGKKLRRKKMFSQQKLPGAWHLPHQAFQIWLALILPPELDAFNEYSIVAAH